MKREAMFDALMELEAAAKNFKASVMDNYHKLNQEDQNKAIADLKASKQSVYAAFDALTPDEIRAYGKYKAVFSLVDA